MPEPLTDDRPDEAAQPELSTEPEAAVLCCRELPAGSLARLLAPFGLEVREVPEGAPIPGSYWGAPEAGIRGSTLFVRPDTPVHSALHEACHLICADPARRAEIDTDAGGGDQEEDAVCYLQIVLADHLPGSGAARQMADMDAWGYTFRLGSTRAWFDHDAEDARAWLTTHGLLTEKGEPAWRSRT